MLSCLQKKKALLDAEAKTHRRLRIISGEFAGKIIHTRKPKQHYPIDCLPAD